MFPFNLTGGSFLVFYACLSVAVLCAFWYFARADGGAESDSRLGELTSDPYQIGYLRGAEEETVRLAVINLADRGLLGAVGDKVKASDNSAAEMLRRPLDRAILARSSQLASLDDLAKDRAVLAACHAYRRDLSAAGLLRGEGRDRLVFVAFVGVLVLLGGLAAVRIIQALSHGRSNVLFLVAMAAAACYIGWRLYSSRRTFAGDTKLRSLETLMSRLKARASSLSPGGATNEALLLASVFGLSVLPAASFPFINQLFPQPRPADRSQGGSDSWDSTSSCSSSSSSGSSCGGGGGSGCGGCGGGD